MIKGMLSIIFAGFLLLGLSACEEEGPMERAGEDIDDAARDIEEGAEDARDEIN